MTPQVPGEAAPLPTNVFHVLSPVCPVLVLLKAMAIVPPQLKKFVAAVVLANVTVSVYVIVQFVVKLVKPVV
jgi:hypothetical protein